MKHPEELTIELDLGVAGEVECYVKFFYSPAERGSRDEPGCDESFDIVSLEANVYSAALNYDVLIDISNFDIPEEKIIEAIRRYSWKMQ